MARSAEALVEPDILKWARAKAGLTDGRSAHRAPAYGETSEPRQAAQGHQWRRPVRHSSGKKHGRELCGGGRRASRFARKPQNPFCLQHRRHPMHQVSAAHARRRLAVPMIVITRHRSDPAKDLKLCYWLDVQPDSFAARCHPENYRVIHSLRSFLSALPSSRVFRAARAARSPREAFTRGSARCRTSPAAPPAPCRRPGSGR